MLHPNTLHKNKDPCQKENQMNTIEHEILQDKLTDAKGLGVGRRPPPGIIPATALAGASSDIALDSSGMTPGEKQQHFSTCRKQTSTTLRQDLQTSHLSLSTL